MKGVSAGSGRESGSDPGSRITRRGFLRAGALAVAAVAGHSVPLTGLRTLEGGIVRGGSSGTADGREVEIHMRSDPSGSRVWFEPTGVLVRPGTKVRWVLGSSVHTTTAYHPDNERPLRMPSGAAAWDSGYMMDPGASFELTLSVEGVYDYFCRPHEAAGMVGRIVVLAEGSDGAALIREGDYTERSSKGALPPAAAAGFPSVEKIIRQASR